jgi:hypothetical protein
MDLHGMTRDDLDDRFRVAAAVDVLAGRPPATRLVLFGRKEAVLAADARPRRPGEHWLDHLVELLYLARVLRPRSLGLCFALRPDAAAADPRFALHVVTAERSLGGRCRVHHRRHPFLPNEEGLLSWDDPLHPPLTAGIEALGRRAMSRTPGSRRRHPELVAASLLEDGHRLQVAPSLSGRVAVAGTITIGP